MIHKLLLITILFTSLYGAKIMPIAKYKSSGAVTDILVNNTKLYSATTHGTIDIFDIKSKKIIKQIKIPKIKDFTGDEVNSKIFSIDILDKKLLILSQASQGYRSIYIHSNGKNKTIIDEKFNLSIAKAKFLNKNTLILALLSNEIISFDMKTKKENWRMQASGARFSDFVLNEDKTQIVVADESGALKICNAKDGIITKILTGQNLDNVFQVDYKNGIIITAGKDRRAVVYSLKSKSSYYKKSSFLIYSVGLSPSGKLAGYASDEDNDIVVFNTATQNTIGVYGGNKMTLTNILFNGEKQFFSSSDSNIINLYNVK